MDVEVIAGPHIGRRGRVVSLPWIGNLWHLWMTVNVPATSREEQWWCKRAWITVHRWQVRKV
jgi:hypothetical protein